MSTGFEFEPEHDSVVSRGQERLKILGRLFIILFIIGLAVWHTSGGAGTEEILPEEPREEIPISVWV